MIMWVQLWVQLWYGILIASGVFLTYLLYRELRMAAEMSKALDALEEEKTRVSKLLDDLLKEERVE